MIKGFLVPQNKTERTVGGLRPILLRKLSSRPLGRCGYRQIKWTSQEKYENIGLRLLLL